MDLALFKNLKDTRVSASGIHNSIEKAIEENVLKPGDKLPSTRDIAQYLGVSRTTVVCAFDTLRAMGYLTSSQGAGTWVEDRFAQTECNTVDSIEENSYPWALRYNALARNLTTISAETIDSIDFDEMNFGSLPHELLPVKQWRQLLQKFSETIQNTGFKDNREVFGYRPLREAVAGYLRRTKGIVCRPEQIIIASGIQSVVSPVFALLAKAEDLAICESPGFWGARELFLSLGVEVETVSTDREGLVVDELNHLDKAAQWIYVAPSCQEPTGVTLSEKRRHQLIDWCSKNDCAILEDDWDSDFQYAGSSTHTLFSLDKSGSVVYYYSFWRLLYPLTSVGILVIPQRLVEIFESYKNVWDRQYTLVEHYVLTDFLKEGLLEKHIRKTWKYLRKCRQSLIFSLKKLFVDMIEVAPSSTGMHILVRFDDSFDRNVIADCSREAKLTIASTELYYVEPREKNEYIVNFALIRLDEIESRVEKFASLMLSKD